MRANKQRFPALCFALLLLPSVGFAATANADEKAANYNMPLICLVGLMLILLFVIGMLGNVLRQLTGVVTEKMRSDRKQLPAVVKTLALLFLLHLPVAHAFASSPADAKQWSTTWGDVSGIPAGDFYTLMSILLLEIGVIFALVLNIRTMLRIMRAKPELAAKAEAVVKNSWFWDKFNAAATLEQEKDILLDHDYDGIQELDNRLPPWWRYGFYVTIVFAIIYLYRFEVSHEGLSQEEEYAVEMQKGDEEKAAYLAKSADKVDENTVVVLTDAASIADGHDIFEKNCSPCHVADGGGNVGPNLTDDYWLHGGGIKNIFKSIKYGWQDKGMKSWKDDLSPKQIQEVASFITTLRGSHPAAPKAPQGDIYIEAGDSKPADSAKTAAITEAQPTAKN